MEFFTHHRARYAMGEQLGLGWLERLSLLTLKSAESLVWHRHEQTEVIASLRGTLNYEFKACPPVTLPPGCFLVIPRNTKHRVVDGIDSPCCRLSIFLQPTPRTSSGTDAFTAKEFARLSHQLIHNKLHPLTFPPHLGVALSRIAKIIETRPSRDRDLELRTLAVFVVHSLATRPPTASWQPVKNPLMDNAVQWLKDHFAEKLSVDQLAAFMGYGRSRLNTLFREHTGLSPTEWLIRYRIDQAKSLLRKGMSIRDAAVQSGFQDPAFFSRTFSQLIGESPRKWAKRQTLP